MISPTLTYNSEVWGVYTKPDFKTWETTQIEKTHLKFCKRYLEVSNKACNVAYRAELGRFPLIRWAWLLSNQTISCFTNRIPMRKKIPANHKRKDQ